MDKGTLPFAKLSWRDWKFIVSGCSVHAPVVIREIQASRVDHAQNHPARAIRASETRAGSASYLRLARLHLPTFAKVICTRLRASQHGLHRRAASHGSKHYSAWMSFIIMPSRAEHLCLKPC